LANRRAHRTLARRPAIVAEPIRDLADSRIAWPRALATRQAAAGARRISKAALDASFASRPVPLGRSFLIPGCRENAYVLDPR
jgi:hypothetical protein